MSNITAVVNSGLFDINNLYNLVEISINNTVLEDISSSQTSLICLKNNLNGYIVFHDVEVP